MPDSSGRQRFVLVTGASSGIGEAIVGSLSRNGFHVIATYQNFNQHNPVNAANTSPVEMDVANSSSIDAAVAAVETIVGNHGLWGLVNCAGVVWGGPMEVMPISLLRQQLETNVIGVVAVTQAFLPSIRRARGRIVNIGSASGRLSTPLLGAYASSKFALEAISDAFRVELRPWGICVTIVDPGIVRTPMLGRFRESIRSAENTMSDVMRKRYQLALDAIDVKSEEAENSGLNRDTIAAAVLKTVVSNNPKARVLVGADAILANILSRFVPSSIVDRIVIICLGMSEWYKTASRDR